MPVIHKKLISPHSAERMFELVDRVEDYPNFLPWCARTEVLLREGDRLDAMLYMDYMKIRQKFGTENHNIPGRAIHMRHLDGPFKHLSGSWHFTPLGDVGCRIEFLLDYEFANGLLTRLIGPVFNHVSNNLINAFIKEADRRYGRTGK